MIRPRRAPPALLALLASLAACGPAPPPERPDLLLISLDTVGALHLGCYGYPRDTTPRLDALAARGVLFEQALSTTSWTMPAHAALLTGASRERHRVGGFGQGPPPGLATLAGALAARGYATAAFVNFTPLEHLLGGFAAREVVAPAEGGAEQVFARAAAWWREAPRPAFAFVHAYDAHAPYRAAPEHAARFVSDYAGPATGGVLQLQRFQRGELALDAGDAAHLRDLYDAGLRELDARLGAFLQGLEAAGGLRDAIVVVVSDHGEEFFEHGGLGHARTLHAELTRVPLVWAGPGLPRGRRVAEPVSLLDVAPTLLALAGAPPLPHAAGVDLAAHWREPERAREPRTLFMATDTWIGNQGQGFRRALRHGRHTLHYDGASGRYALYDVARDPGEQVDLAGSQPEALARLRPLLEPTLAAPGSRPAPALPEALRGELSALGYLDGDSGE